MFEKHVFRRLLLAIIAIAAFHGETAARQQPVSEQAQEAEGDDAAERLRVLLRIENEQHEQARATTAWALLHDQPGVVRQPDGSLVQLVAIRNGIPVFRQSHNRNAGLTTHTDALRPGGELGLGLTGKGLAVGVWDEGTVLATHPEFAGRLDVRDPPMAANHSTHVAGTIGASGLRPAAQGMAIETTILSYDWTDDASEMIIAAGRDSLLVSNHSYGPATGWTFADLENTGVKWYWTGDLSVSRQEDASFGRYDAESSRYDAIVASNPYLLPVVSAGNDRSDRGPSQGTYRATSPATGDWRTYRVDQQPLPADGGTSGFDTIAGQALGKNVLTVGSIGDRANGGSASISSFTSFGPVDDGRIKPDLVANGESLLSPVASGDDAYGNSSGTSMASPNVAGSLILLQELYRSLRGRSMRASTLKGLAIHTAEDLGIPGPDYRFGWGLFDARAAATHIIESLGNKLAIVEGELSDGESVNFSLLVPLPGRVRVTLTWTDPRSFVTGKNLLDDPIPHLRNDLDLIFIEHSTQIGYQPFKPDPDRPGDAAERGDNIVDNVEQVLITSVSAGTHSLVISHKGQLSGRNSQHFSLLISGAVDEIRYVGIPRLESTFAPDGVHLAWQTIYERTSGRFRIERRSGGDEGSFLAIGSLPMVGSPSNQTSYAFVDPELIPGRQTYRIIVEPSSGDESVASETIVDIPLADFDTFTASASVATVRLAWETTFEVAPGEFIVERTPVLLDGPGPTELVSRLQGRGTPESGASYSIDDQYVPAGKYIYKITRTAPSAGVEQAQALEVLVPIPDQLQIIALYPNPTSAGSVLLIDVPASTAIKIDIFDASGRRKAGISDEILRASRYEFVIDTHDWAPGLYIVHVVGESGRISRKLVVVK